MDRLATRTDPLGAVESFVYDLAGNLTQRTDRKGQVSAFGYDLLNRLTSASYAGGSGTGFTYDTAGRLIRIDDSVGGTLTNTYDVLDRLLAQSTTLGTVSYQYDALGRRTQLNVPGVAPTTYTYDPASRLTQILQGTQTVGFQYDEAGRRTLLTLPNSVSTEYQYDLASRLTALIYRNAAGDLGNLTYQYDPAGNRRRVGGSFARTLLPNAVATAVYDAANRQRVFGDAQMTFDASGNLTAIAEVAGTTAFTWDARDRLLSLELPGVLTTYAYAFGRRIAKTVSGVPTQFLYDGLDIIQQLEPQGTTTGYLRSPAIDEMLGLTNRGGSFFAIADALGSVLVVTDIAGSPVTEYTYESFGATTVTNSGFANPFQFADRENDGSLYHYRARYYSPIFHRFISPDPIGISGGDVNYYAYVGNNPQTFADPLGLERDCPSQAAELLERPVVRQALREGLRLQTATDVEQSGSVLRNRFTRAVSFRIINNPRATRYSGVIDQLGWGEWLLYSSLATFHTHPLPEPGILAGPSGTDIRTFAVNNSAASVGELHLVADPSTTYAITRYGRTCSVGSTAGILGR